MRPNAVIVVSIPAPQQGSRHDETLVWSRPDRSTVRCGCVHHQRRGSQGRHRRQSLWPGGGGGGRRAARLKCYVYSRLYWCELSLRLRGGAPSPLPLSFQIFSQFSHGHSSLRPSVRFVPGAERMQATPVAIFGSRELRQRRLRHLRPRGQVLAHVEGQQALVACGTLAWRAYRATMCALDLLATRLA